MGAAGLPCSHPGTSTQPWAWLSPPLWGQGRATQGSGLSLHVALCVSCSSQGKAPQDTLAQPCRSHLIWRVPHLLQVFLQHLLRGFTCGRASQRIGETHCQG